MELTFAVTNGETLFGVVEGRLGVNFLRPESLV